MSPLPPWSPFLCLGGSRLHLLRLLPVPLQPLSAAPRVAVPVQERYMGIALEKQRAALAVKLPFLFES